MSKIKSLSMRISKSIVSAMSPERPGSAQEEISSTPKMSVPGSPVAGTPIRDAQSPISILLAVAQSQSGKTGDDDLTSLSWLHERDLLKGMNINPSPSNSTNSTPIKNGVHLLSDQSPTSDYVDDSSISAPESSNSSVSSPTPANASYSSIAQYQTGNQRVRHPHNIPYDPLIHTNNKPPYSFSCLIFMAIEDSRQKALPVKEIYAWILDHFPYFKNAPTGWKNSVRHNLSLNKCFQKVEKAPNLGKGSLWTVDPQYKPNLIQALNRSPFHPCSALDPASLYATPSPPLMAVLDKPNPHRIPTLPNPDLFPYLSKKLAASESVFKNSNNNNSNSNGNNNNNTVKIKRELSNEEESLDAADAAAVMLSLKNGARLNSKDKYVFQIITTSPSQDHTYSAAENGDNADEAFESDEDRLPKSRTCRKIDFEDDEERKIKEGAETLLNLAGMSSRKRGLSHSEDGSQKRIKTEYEGDENIDNDERPAPFKPRLLRAKKRETPTKVIFNNNEDEWVRHRRELEISQAR